MSKRPKREPWHPAAYDEADMSAIKALARDEQHARALHWIVHNLCGTYDQPFRPGPDGDRETVFACAKQFVGQQIVKLINMPMPPGDKQLV